MSGTVVVTQKDFDTLTLTYKLQGLTATDGDTGGLHIHAGMSCATDAGKHFYDNTTGTAKTDPWTTTWQQTAGAVSGTFDIAGTGYTAQEVLARTIVVHDKGGVKVGCGVIMVGSQEGNPFGKVFCRFFSGLWGTANFVFLLCGSSN